MRCKNKKNNNNNDDDNNNNWQLFGALLWRRYSLLVRQDTTLCDGHCRKNKNNNWMVANNVDPGQTPRFAASDLDLHCLLRSVFRNT